MTIYAHQYSHEDLLDLTVVLMDRNDNDDLYNIKSVHGWHYIIADHKTGFEIKVRDYDVRIATANEKAAGHRIDTPPNSTISPYSHDLPKDGAMVQDGEKEAVSANERGFDVWLHALYEESPSINENKFIVGAQLAWQHQQAVVDQCRAEKEELQKRVGDALAKIDQFWCEGDLDSLREAEKALGADHESN